ncbi:MAG: hypothetical protein D3904_18500 [Candidatus Electrothrix sp. EH2]|nr:hypothetical protein [Candidatus Electrothrix sp. EH2]
MFRLPEKGSDGIGQVPDMGKSHHARMITGYGNFNGFCLGAVAPSNYKFDNVLFYLTNMCY